MGKHTIKFGTDGWRAVIADGFTFENVEIVVNAIAKYLLNHFSTKQPVVIGYDTRFLADQFASRAAQVLQSYGFSVLLTKTYTPTPLVAFAAKEYDTAGALMFTASHNPPEYCGIKFIPHYAGPATPEITDELLKNVQEIVTQNTTSLRGNQQGALEYFSPLERYVTFLSKQIDFEAIRQRPLRILYDSMFGAGQGYLDHIFEKYAGYKIDMIHQGRDPLFGGRIPEPKGEYLPELIKMVPEGKYDIGFANDGDADRFGAIDNTGRYLAANQILPLLFWYLYNHHGYRGSVVRTVATSMLMDCLAEKYQIPLHETPVGFKYVGEIMRQENVIIGGEESGGLSVLGHIPEKDGILANLLITEMVAKLGKPLSQIYEEMLEDAGIRLSQISINLHLSEEQKQSMMSHLKSLKEHQSFGDLSIQKIDTRDGIKLVFGSYEWLLIRPSGTEPILRLYGESPSAERLSRLQETVESLLKVPQPVH